MAGRTSFENLQVYKLGEKLADEVWRVVTCWEQFAKTTVGRQIVRAADRIGPTSLKVPGEEVFKTIDVS